MAGLEKLTLHQPLSADGVGFEQFRAFSPHKMWHINRQNAHKRLNFQFARKARDCVYLVKPGLAGLKKSLFVLRNKGYCIIIDSACQNKTERGPHLQTTFLLAERLFVGLPALAYSIRNLTI
ncbi:MAG: hypothetical protein AUJ70_02250 [Candidatus Omnitrophica bacterium CG1_02_40_15]|nr:MAG: hypothetical protein AUJ70_02250 [Candidatus Omnitrophica bacterium CG1_02_40_15]